MMTDNKVDLKGESLEDFKKFLKKNLQSLLSDTETIRKTKLTEWRRIYEAKPLNDKRDFPFSNACNLVIPIVAIHTDTLISRVMASVFKTRPLWPVEAVGSFKGKAAQPIKALSNALGYYAMNPWELNLFQVYKRWLGDIVPYGFGVIKLPYRKITEDIRTGDSFTSQTKYEGVKPEHVPFDKFLCKTTAVNIEDCIVKSHIISMTEDMLEERKENKKFNKEGVESVLKVPDRFGPDTYSDDTQSDAETEQSDDENSKEWDIHEVHCVYKIGNYRPRLIAWYHVQSNELLRCVYTDYPTDPFVIGRLLERSGSLYGYGFAQILGGFQEEISQIHCQRRDAQTVANAKFMRVSPNSKLTPNYQIAPGSQVPAEKDEIEAMSFGEPSQMNIEEERLALDLAERRSGITSPFQGAGAGAFNKRGIYSTFGTFSVMQEGNNRLDLTISDFRDAHVKVGRIITGLMAKYQDEQSHYLKFGDEAKDIVAALKAIKNEEMSIAVNASNASINREVEKQSDIMFVNMMKGHYDFINKLITQSQMQGVSPASQKYLGEAAGKFNKFMERILSNFGYSDPDAYLPSLENESTNAASRSEQSDQQKLQGVIEADQLSRMGESNGVPGIPNANSPAQAGNIQ